MIYNLKGRTKEKVFKLIKNTSHELSIECVIHGTSFGEVYADSEDKPESCLIRTAECNVLAGNPYNREFNSALRDHIDYWDQLTCDSREWDSVVPELHPNLGIRIYKRNYYELNEQPKSSSWETSDGIELIYPKNIEQLHYRNRELVVDWNAIEKVEEYTNLCLAAVKICDNQIVACSAVDCVSGDSIEIGVRTEKEYRNKGYGSSLVSALVAESFSNGIKRIGWHCVSTNSGSQKIAEKCGFRFVKEYVSHTPFPPIENKSDLTKSQWQEYALFFQEKGLLDINQYWQAARCWAFAEDMRNTLECIGKLAEKNIWWFTDYLSNNEEFETFKTDASWKQAIKSFDEKSR